MYLGPDEVGYFIEQIGLACSSFGFSDDDVDEAVDTFNRKFNVRCHPAEVIVAHQGSQNNSICQAPECDLADNGICPAFQPGEPMYINKTVSFGEGSGLCTNASCLGQGDEVLTNGSFAGDGGIASGPTVSAAKLEASASASASPVASVSQATRGVGGMMRAVLTVVALVTFACTL